MIVPKLYSFRNYNNFTILVLLLHSSVKWRVLHRFWRVFIIGACHSPLILTSYENWWHCYLTMATSYFFLSALVESRRNNNMVLKSSWVRATVLLLSQGLFLLRNRLIWSPFSQAFELYLLHFLNDLCLNLGPVAGYRFKTYHRLGQLNQNDANLHVFVITRELI